MTDDLLLQRAARGDEAAFLLLYERHRDLIVRFAYRLLGSMASAEDVAHDTFLEVIRNPGRFKPDRASFRTYVCSIARHFALTRQRRYLRAALLDRQTSSLVGSGHQLDVLMEDERAAAVRRAVLQLPASQRDVVVLFDFEGLTLAETAAVVGVNVGAVKARLHRARERLRRSLQAYVSTSSGSKEGIS